MNFPDEYFKFVQFFNSRYQPIESIPEKYFEDPEIYHDINEIEISVHKN